VDERIGGRTGLAALRKRLKARGLRLLLDYVPNHVAIDHPWVHQPGFIVQGKPQDLKGRGSDFFRINSPTGEEIILAHGRDPYFAGWSDTAQLNAFNPRLRRAVADTLLDIGAQCDGVRCDMAMLLMNDIFGSTWHGCLKDPVPALDYWPEIIPQIKARYPDFLFVAEVYWNKEYDMLVQGFDYAYDKLLYDRIVGGDVPQLRAHLVAAYDYQKRMMRFIENHDEPRAYAALGPNRSMPAATLICTLPGACLLHDGQLIGRKAKLPVQITRQPDEPVDWELYGYYMRLLEETRHPIYEHGEWYLFETRAQGDETHANLLSYGWRQDGQYRLVVVNLTGGWARARVPLQFWSELAGARWTLHDVIDSSSYERDGDEMTGAGLYVELAPYESHIFRFEKA
jgi:hypothetical protein